MAALFTLLIALHAVFLTTVTATTIPTVGNKQSDVTIKTLLLTDLNRLDPFANDGRPRSIVASIYYPVTGCRHKQLEPNMPPATAQFMDKKFAPYGLPNGTFTSLTVETCKKASTIKHCSSSPLPLVLFSGALGTSRLLYNSMLQSIATAGYLVISVDHPYDADIVEFPNGTIITAANISSDADVDLAVTTRVNDIAFLYQQLHQQPDFLPGLPHTYNVTNTAMIGHSLGGATAASSLLRIPSLLGALNIDGTMFGSILTTPRISQPFMLLGHENKTQDTDPSWKTVWPRVKGWKKEFEVKGAAHYGFSDLPLILSVLGLGDRLGSEIEGVLGRVEGKRMMEITTMYTLAFLDMVLKGGKEGGFARASKEFPEVVQVA